MKKKIIMIFYVQINVKFLAINFSSKKDTNMIISSSFSEKLGALEKLYVSFFSSLVKGLPIFFDPPSQIYIFSCFKHDQKWLFLRDGG